MREISFRGKRLDGKGWVYGYYSTETMGGYIHPEHGDIGGEVCHFIMDEGMDNHEVIPETVGQFTGLRDKNGQEVYEGDICKQRGDTCVIESCIGGFQCRIVGGPGKGKGSIYIFSFLYPKACEVIGNTWEGDGPPETDQAPGGEGL